MVYIPDVMQEKQHLSLIKGVENFNINLLKHADTNEKIVLPSAQGFSSIYSLVLFY